MSGEGFLGSAWRTVSYGELLIGAAWKRLTRGEMYKDGAWRSLASFTPTLTVSVTPAPAIAYTSPLHPTSSTAFTVMTATPAGGLGPYTYLYSIVSSTGSTPVIATPTLASTRISKTVPAFADITDDFNVVVTDSLGATASQSFSIEFINEPIEA